MSVGEELSSQGLGTILVTHRASPDQSFETPALRIDRDGIEVTGFPLSMKDVRFVWLEFAVPENPTQRIKALGEVEPANGSLSRRVRFKHLFPDQRRHLDELIARRNAEGRVALRPRRVIN